MSDSEQSQGFVLDDSESDGYVQSSKVVKPKKAPAAKKATAAAGPSKAKVCARGRLWLIPLAGTSKEACSEEGPTRYQEDAQRLNQRG